MTEFDRTEIVLKEQIEKIKNSSILLLGVGGVGGYVFEMLVRLGIGKITVVDCDKFEITNFNRQLYSTYISLGKDKAEVARLRAKEISKHCVVTAKVVKISADNLDSIFNDQFDYVIDCIDDVNAKIAVIKYCDKNQIPLISSMGTGNRYKNPHFEVVNLWKTCYDGLAKKIRNILRKDNFVSKVDVVCCMEQSEKTDSLGSVVYYPLMCAGRIVSFVANKLIEK